jgi:hypothetical protein
MRVSEALEQIATIHDQLTKSEVYSGLRVWAVLVTGFIGFAGAIVQPFVIGSNDPQGFVGYWLGLALVAGLIGVFPAFRSYYLRDDNFAKRKTIRIVLQFGPSLVVGGAMTIAFLRAGEALIFLLPGVWAMIFALGIFTIRPYLPRAIGWVALYFLLAGMFLVWKASHVGLSGWSVGGVFGVGHVAFALVLHFNLERRTDA